MICRLTTALIVLSLAAPAAAQVTVLRWTVDDGLPNNAVSDVRQTRDGYLWIATWAGLARFDGARFTPIADDLQNDHVRVVLEAREGSMWIGLSGGGVVQWRGRVVRTVETRDLRSAIDVRALVEDADGRIWAATDKGVTVIDRTGVAGHLGVSEGLPDESVNDLGVGRSGAIWVATDAGVCAADLATLRCAPAVFAGRADAVHETRGGKLLIGGVSGLLEDGAVRLPGRHVTSILEPREGGIWAGFDNGEVARLDGGTVTIYGSDDGLLAGGPVAALRQDEEGSIWIGTYNAGLSRLKPTRVRTYSTGDGLPAKVIGSIVQDAAGRIWAASQCGPVAELAADRFVPRLLEHTGDACAWVMLAARDGALWIGTRGQGLFRWDGVRMRHFTRDDGLSDMRISGLFEDRDGAIWIGTELGGLHRYERGALSRAFDERDGVRTTYIASFAQDREGRVWIGSNANGLSVYEAGRFRALSGNEAPATNNIAGLLIDSRGELWIGSANDGLFRRRNGAYDHFGAAQGLGDRLVAVMIEDAAANLWVHTARGISRLMRDRIEEVAAGRAASLEPIILDRTDGLRTLEGSGGGLDPSGLRAADGRLWFSSVDGIAVIDPATFVTNPVAPKVAIEGVSLSGGPPEPAAGGSFQVPAGTASVEVDYTALSFVSPSKVRFRYRLLGLDDVWRDVGNRRAAYFTGLRPGSYTFEVTAANNDGVWARQAASIEIDVEPLWWERRAVQTAAFFSVLLIGALAVRHLTLRRARARLQALERAQALDRERSRIARDLHDDLGSRLAHIALMAEGIGQSAGVPVAAAVRESLQTMDELVWTVNARNDTVESFGHYASEFVQAQAAAAGLKCRLQIDPDAGPAPLGADTRRHLYLGLKEAINNVVKHAGASEVIVGLGSADGVLRLTISDDGRGLDERATRTGNGLRNMEERMKAAGGSVRVESGPGRGCRVTFEVPLVEVT